MTQAIRDALGRAVEAAEAATAGEWTVAKNFDGIYAATNSVIRSPKGEVAGPRQLGRNEDRNVEDNAAALVASVNFLRDHGRALMEALEDAERYRFLRVNAHQKTAYDIYGDGGHWFVGFYSKDQRATFDESVDTARQEPPHV